MLKLISDAMSVLNLEYGFGTYKGNSKGKIVYPYFVGEYIETEGFTEDGLQEYTFMLTGFHRGDYIRLEEAREQIENYFTRAGTSFSEGGSVTVIMYANSFPVPKEDAELKSIQINLRVNEWKVI